MLSQIAGNVKKKFGYFWKDLAKQIFMGKIRMNFSEILGWILQSKDKNDLFLEVLQNIIAKIFHIFFKKSPFLMKMKIGDDLFSFWMKIYAKNIKYILPSPFKRGKMA